MIVFEPGGRPTITALTQCTLMCLGGEPVGERIIWWNWWPPARTRSTAPRPTGRPGRTTRASRSAGDDQEFIPLPVEERPAERMS
jgi:hypothetical protein